jgi:hypothetical protein
VLSNYKPLAIMNSMPWRSNIVACYFSTDMIGKYRKCVMDLFDTLATIHSLECIASKDCLMTDDPLDGKKPAAWSIFDIVYVRSTPRTTISRLKFEKMIQAIFDREDGDDSKEYLVCPMLQSGLKKFPYPKKD